MRGLAVSRRAEPARCLRMFGLARSFGDGRGCSYWASSTLSPLSPTCTNISRRSNQATAEPCCRATLGTLDLFDVRFSRADFLPRGRLHGHSALQSRYSRLDLVLRLQRALTTRSSCFVPESRVGGCRSAAAQLPLTSNPAVAFPTSTRSKEEPTTLLPSAREARRWSNASPPFEPIVKRGGLDGQRHSPHITSRIFPRPLRLSLYLAYLQRQFSSISIHTTHTAALISPLLRPFEERRTKPTTALGAAIPSTPTPPPGFALQSTATKRRPGAELVPNEFTMGSERWERDRFEDDRYYMRGGRGRERSEDRYDRSRYYEDDFVRDRRYHDDEPRYEPRREPARQPEFDRRMVIEKERDREYYRDSSPRRPAFLRRQSSLDTYDRRPLRNIFDQREEYPPPARREDIFRDEYRAPPYTPIPLPKARGLPPPGRRDDRYYDYRPESEYYPEDEYRHMPERVREREIIRERDRRDRSRESRGTRTHTHRSSSRSSSSSSSSGGGATVRSEYPKKGKTKIPVRLVSKRALIDLGYPYVEEVRLFSFFVCFFGLAGSGLC